MAFQPQPGLPGSYFVKVYNSGTNRYWKYVAGRVRWIQLVIVDENDVNFKWNIYPVQGTSDVFTISPVSDPSVGFYAPSDTAGKYWNYGFPEGRVGASDNWQFRRNSKGYSNIKVNGASTVLDCRDTNASCVHFYADEDSDNQRFVFQLILSNRPGIKAYPFLDRRPIVPAQAAALGNKRQAVPPGAILPDLDSVQGDVYFMFPKKWERFIFFKINDANQFRKDLDTFSPSITSSTQTASDLDRVHIKGNEDLDIISHGIAFSKAGLKKLGITNKLEDPHFDQGSLVNEKKLLGDMAEYDRVFATDGYNDGVILITAGKKDTCKKRMDVIHTIFTRSIEVLTYYEGRARPFDGEPFGWRDGISQPAIKNVGFVKPGQRVVKPGVIILGYAGDPAIDNSVARPAFTKDGSFMVFRKLEQNVLVLEDYVEKNWQIIPPNIAPGVNLNDQQRKDLFAARMVGRFKSGVPLALSPYVDDQSFLAPDKINNFTYTETSTRDRCPWAAHVRKTSPRDLKPVISDEYLDASVIVRAAIAYGDDVTQDDRDTWKTLNELEKWTDPISMARGLLFVCYQSSLENGFVRQTIKFANADAFPPNPTTTPSTQNVGQDPIIGGPPNPPLPPGAVEPLKVDQLSNKFKQEYFVTSRGGDYYFMPSIKAVKSWGAAAQGGGAAKPFQAQPTVAGTYRVKVYNTGTDRYWKYVVDKVCWIQLATVDENSDLFKWNIAPVPGVPNVFTIRPVYDASVGFYSPDDAAGKYWGYGFPEGRVGASDQWKIKSANGSYSKSIKVNGYDYVLDCRDTSASCVHFYQDDDGPNQHFVFQPV